MKRDLKAPSKASLDAMVDEATVDCNNESEEATGLFTMIEEHLKLPVVRCLPDRVQLGHHPQLPLRSLTRCREQRKPVRRNESTP